MLSKSHSNYLKFVNIYNLEFFCFEMEEQNNDLFPLVSNHACSIFISFNCSLPMQGTTRTYYHT